MSLADGRPRSRPYVAVDRAIGNRNIALAPLTFFRWRAFPATPTPRFRIRRAYPTPVDSLPPFYPSAQPVSQPMQAGKARTRSRLVPQDTDVTSVAPLIPAALRDPPELIAWRASLSLYFQVSSVSPASDTGSQQCPFGHLRQPSIWTSPTRNSVPNTTSLHYDSS